MFTADIHEFFSATKRFSPNTDIIHSILWSCRKEIFMCLSIDEQMQVSFLLIDCINGIYFCTAHCKSTNIAISLQIASISVQDLYYRPRLFSKAGIALTEKRRILNSAHLEVQMFFDSNSELWRNWCERDWFVVVKESYAVWVYPKMTYTRILEC